MGFDTVMNSRAPLSERGNDLYETPPEAVHALLAVEDIPTLVWEPACGPGAISRVLEESGRIVRSTDLIEYGFGTAGVDFLKQEDSLGAQAIITNPPYKDAEAFIEKACDLCPRVYMLLRLAFLESARRKSMFERLPLARVLVFSRRLPMMHRAGWAGNKTNSSMAHAWFVFDAGHIGEPVIRWVDWKECVQSVDYAQAA